MLAENSPIRAPIHSPQSPNAPDAMVLALVALCPPGTLAPDFATAQSGLPFHLVLDPREGPEWSKRVMGSGRTLPSLLSTASQLSRSFRPSGRVAPSGKFRVFAIARSIATKQSRNCAESLWIASPSASLRARN